MKNEVQFNPDERALLDWLQGRVKADNALTISDTALRDALGWDEKRFFVAKGHLLCAGALGMYRDGNGRQMLRLLMPERPGKPSKRYVFRVLPLELLPKIQAIVMAERRRAQAPNLPLLRKPVPATGTPGIPGKPAVPLPPRDFKEAQEAGQRGLGVSPVKGPTFRPPLKRNG